MLIWGEPYEVEAWVCSSGRAPNVQRLEAAMGTQLGWCVPKGQGEDYEVNGAVRVMEVEGPLPNLCGQRNAVLDHCFDRGKIAFLLDDDIKQLRMVLRFKEGGKAVISGVTLPEAITHLMAAMHREGSHARLGGFAATQNWLYVMDRPMLDKSGLVCQLFLCLPSDIRFDPAMEFTEDYDFCLQHQAKYGEVARDNHVLVTAMKKINRGGHQDLGDRYANDVAARQRLAEKWPDNIIWPHPKKGPDEVKVKTWKVP